MLIDEGGVADEFIVEQSLKRIILNLFRRAGGTCIVLQLLVRFIIFSIQIILRFRGMRGCCAALCDVMIGRKWRLAENLRTGKNPPCQFSNSSGMIRLA